MKDVLGIPYPEAEKIICNPQHYHIPSFKRRAGSTDDGKVLTKKQKVSNYSTTATSSLTHDECVINYEGTVSPNQMKRFESPQYVLENDDKDTILKGQMLTDRHIMMAQPLLKIQFPEIDGLLSPTLGPAGQFPPIANEFVQIVNTIKSHWVCLSTIVCVDPGTIKYYCSVNNTNLTKDTQKKTNCSLTTSVDVY